MHELLTLPASVRQRLELSEATPQRGVDPEALWREAALALAREHPELLTLILGSKAGVTTVTHTRLEVNEYLERIERKFLGISLGEQFVPVTTRRTVTETWRVS